MRVFRKITARSSSLPASFRACIQTFKIVLFGTSLVLQRFRLYTPTAGGMSSTPSPGTKILCSTVKYFFFQFCFFSEMLGYNNYKKKKRKKEKKESSLCPGRGLSVSQQRPRLEQSGTRFQKYILYRSCPHYAREPRDSQLGGHLYREQKSCCSVEARMIQRKSFGAPSLFPDM